MEKLAPFSMSIIETEEYVKRKECMPVTAYAMYEPSTERFHPDGLFSEVIFGQLGSSQRFIRRAYIDLHTKLITPHLFKQIMELKSYYRDILAGKQYAYFDPELKDLMRTTSDDPRGDTGYQFFVSNYPKIDFKETTSNKRSTKIKLLKKYKDRIFTTKYLVLPAAVRDVKIKDGRAESEAINKLYLGLMSLASAIPAEDGDDPVFDTIRYQMQCKIQEIYVYITTILNGKTGFNQTKYAARTIAYGSRNVITTPQMVRVDSPLSPNMMQPDDIEVPTFQALKVYAPLAIHYLNVNFFSQIFSNPNEANIPLINSKTLQLEYHRVSDSELHKYTTNEGLNDVINDLRDVHLHKKPVAFELHRSEQVEPGTEFYAMLVYDNGDKIYWIRDLESFINGYSKTSRYRDDNEKLRVVEPYNTHDYVIEGTGSLYAYGMDIVPEDVDVIFNIPQYHEFIKLAESKGIEPDELGEYEMVVDGIEIHTKNCCYGVVNESAWEQLISNDVVTIGRHQYIKPEVLAARYRAMAGRPDRLKDKRKLEFFEDIIFDPDKVRPLTWLELGYTIACVCNVGKHMLSTRYPVTNLYNMVPYHGHIMSTIPSRIATIVVNPDAYEMNGRGLLLSEYPVIGAATKQSLSVHPITLAKYQGDHDGDALSLIALMSDEANKELEDYLQSSSSILDSAGNLRCGLDGSGGAVINMSLFFCTYHSLE